MHRGRYRRVKPKILNKQTAQCSHPRN